MLPKQQARTEAQVNRAANKINKSPIGDPNAAETAALTEDMTIPGGVTACLKKSFPGLDDTKITQLEAKLKDALGDEHGTDNVALVVLATALSSLGKKDVEGVTKLLVATVSNEGESAEVFRLQRMLATTDAGTVALAGLLGKSKEEVKSLRDQLSICSALETQGLMIHAYTSPTQVLEKVTETVGRKMADQIGHRDDDPLQLLAQALKYSLVPPPEGTEPEPERSAFVAWEKGGFVTSGEKPPGKKSDFNLTIERMHKFLVHVDRADHGDRTVANMARDAGNLLGRTVGIGKSPLSATRYGSQGSDRELLHIEAAKLKAALDTALDVAASNLMDDLRDPAISGKPVERNKCLARAAVFSLWKKTGETTHTHDAVAEEALALLEEHQIGGGVVKSDLAPHIEKFTKKVRGEPKQFKVDLKAFEAMGVARSSRKLTAAAAKARDPEIVATEIVEHRNAVIADPHDKAARALLTACQNERKYNLSKLIAEMKQIEKGIDDKIPLFKFSDLRVLIGKEARKGPNKANVFEVLQKKINAPSFESMSTFADGTSRGVGTFGAASLAGIPAALGVPLIYPILKMEGGKQAVVTIGESGPGFRFVMGTETSRSVVAGAGGGWVAPTIASNHVKAVALAEASVSYTQVHATGAAITIRNMGDDEWKKETSKVLKFMEKQAGHSRDDSSRPVNASVLWSRFAKEFETNDAVRIGWNDEVSIRVNAQASAVAVARGSLDGVNATGPVLSATIQGEKTDFTRTPNAGGADVLMGFSRNQINTTLAAALTQSAPGVDTPHGGLITGWGTGVPLVGGSVQWSMAGGLGVARLGRDRDGKLNYKMCERELIFERPQTLIAYALANRDTWIKHLASPDDSTLEGLEEGEDKDAVIRAAIAAGTPEAERRFDAFLQQVAALPPGGANLHGETLKLKPTTAEKVNQLEARLKAIMGDGDGESAKRTLSPLEKAECEALKKKVRDLLVATENWDRGGMYSVEYGATSTTTGLNFGLRLANVETARAGHLTTLLYKGQEQPQIAEQITATASVPTQSETDIVIPEESEAPLVAQPAGRAAAQPPSPDEASSIPSAVRNVSVAELESLIAEAATAPETASSENEREAAPAADVAPRSAGRTHRPIRRHEAGFAGQLEAQVARNAADALFIAKLEEKMSKRGAESSNRGVAVPEVGEAMTMEEMRVRTNRV